MRNDLDLNSFRNTLIEKRKALLKRVDAITNDLRRGEEGLDEDNNLEWSEQAQKLENDEVLEALDEAGRLELEAIQSALDRMNNDKYGICVKCGKNIAVGRLEALPATPFCIKCA